MLNPGDRVNVIKSKRNITGPGEIVELAFAGRYLVKMDDPTHKVILVLFQDMRKSDALVEFKSKKK